MTTGEILELVVDLVTSYQYNGHAAGTLLLPSAAALPAAADLARLRIASLSDLGVHSIAETATSESPIDSPGQKSRNSRRLSEKPRRPPRPRM